MYCRNTFYTYITCKVKARYFSLASFPKYKPLSSFHSSPPTWTIVNRFILSLVTRPCHTNSQSRTLSNFSREVKTSYICFFVLAASIFHTSYILHPFYFAHVFPLCNLNFPFIFPTYPFPQVRNNAWSEDVTRHSREALSYKKCII